MPQQISTPSASRQRMTASAPVIRPGTGGGGLGGASGWAGIGFVAFM